MSDLQRDSIGDFMQYNKVKCYIIFFAAFSFIMIWGISIPSQAQVIYQNTNGYEVFFEDTADLLTEEEEMQLQEKMLPITEYGNVAFKSISKNNISTSEFAERYCSGRWGEENGIVFIMDKDDQTSGLYKIDIKSNGYISEIITNAYAFSIKNSVLNHVYHKEYYISAVEVYEQINLLMEDGAISKPMRYICNLALAIALAFLVLYYAVKQFYAAQRPSEKELVEAMVISQELKIINEKFVYETETISSEEDYGSTDFIGEIFNSGSKKDNHWF